MNDRSVSKSSTLSINEVEHVAHLANLGLSKEDILRFQKQLSDILDFVAKLNEIDTKNVIPTSQVTGLENVLREDIVKKSLTQDEVLSNAPRKYKGFFVVDAIFE